MDEILKKYKIYFNGLNNINDVNKLITLLNLSEEEKGLIINYYLTLNLSKVISIEEFEKILVSLNKLKYQEDVLENIYKLSSLTNDKAQINCLYRLALSKEHKLKYCNLIDVKSKTKNFGLNKICPHCFHENLISPLNTYAICGYNNIHEGYDWQGCGRDWCVECGKKLCKKWNENYLFMEENRFHNNECCEIHAKKTDSSYLNDYCHCFNKYVNRSN